MYRPYYLWVFAALAIITSILLTTQVIDKTSEEERYPTNCSVASIAPRFDTSTIVTKRSKEVITIDLVLNLDNNKAIRLGNTLSYDVTMRAVDDLLNSDVEVVHRGRAAVHNRTAVPTTFVIANTTFSKARDWEVTLFARTQGGNSDTFGVDTIYMSIDNADDKLPRLTVANPAKYWDRRMTEANRSNTTLLGSVKRERNQACDCSAPSHPLNQPLHRLGPRAGLTTASQSGFTLHFDVKYQTGAAPSSPMFGLPGAKVVFTYKVNVFEPGIHIPPKEQLVNLDDDGRASTFFSTTPEDGTTTIYGAKLVLDDYRFGALKFGTAASSLKTYEFWLQKTQSGDQIYFDGTIPQSLGPNAAVLWANMQKIRSSAEALLGLKDIPQVNIWFPGVGGTQYYPGSNLIEHLSGDVIYPEVGAHEYGHHFMWSVMNGGFAPTAGTPHGFCPGFDIDENMALVEGYATGFGLQILGQQNYGAWPIGSFSCTGDRDMTKSEGRFAAGLLDLMDDDSGNPECNGGIEDLGRKDRCDRTRGGQLFTPRVVLRDSIAGPQVRSISNWWARLLGAHQGQLGVNDGREAMEYNYYPLSTRQRRLGRVWLDRFLLSAGITSFNQKS